MVLSGLIVSSVTRFQIQHIDLEDLRLFAHQLLEKVAPSSRDSCLAIPYISH